MPSKNWCQVISKWYTDMYLRTIFECWNGIYSGTDGVFLTIGLFLILSKNEVEGLKLQLLLPVIYLVMSLMCSKEEENIVLFHLPVTRNLAR